MVREINKRSLTAAMLRTASEKEQEEPTPGLRAGTEPRSTRGYDLPFRFADWGPIVGDLSTSNPGSAE